MKRATELITNTVIVIALIIFSGLSFADFYTITMTGSAIDDLSGDFVQSTERIRNSLFSVACTLLPFISFIIKRRWARMLAIFASILNFLIITLIYPTLVSAMSIIGSSYSASLTSIGWIGTIIILLIIFLLFTKEYYLKNM